MMKFDVYACRSSKCGNAAEISRANASIVKLEIFSSAVPKLIKIITFLEVVIFIDSLNLKATLASNPLN